MPTVGGDAAHGDQPLRWRPGAHVLTGWGRIAFDSTRSGRDQIWVMNGDGSGQTQLTDTTEGNDVLSAD